MARTLDLKILPIYQRDGEVLSLHPGLHVALPPRKTSRRRSRERLVLHLTLGGNAPLSQRAKEQILTRLGDIFYESKGSTTSALRDVSEVLNAYLLDRNLRGASRGVQAVGILTQVVIRDTRVILAQSGATRSLLINPGEIDELHDPDLAGPGLGVGRTVKVRYHQWDVEDGHLILITPQLPSTWTHPALKSLTSLETDGIFNRLLHRVEEDLDAVLLSLEEGKGKVRVIRPILEEQGKKAALPTERPDSAPKAEEPGSAPASGELGASPTTEGPVPPAGESPLSEGIQADPSEDPPEPVSDTTPEGSEIPPGISEPGPQPLAGESEPAPGGLEGGSLKPQAEDKMEVDLEGGREGRTSARDGSALQGMLAGIAGLPFWPVLGTLFSSLSNALVEVWRNAAALMNRMLPDEEVLNLPSWVLGLIAVLVPLVMVTFGSVFYIRRGRNRLYQDAYQQAQTLLTEAELSGQPADNYQALAEAMEYLSLARSYQATEAIDQLYSQTREELDALERITRLEYKPLFTRGLGADVQISEVVVTPWNDLYLLNSTDGSVIWAQSNADGYEIQGNFTCGPVTGHKEIGPLVDIVALPTTQEDQASLLGIDRSQTMIFCYADADEPPVLFEDTSYTLSRGEVQAITLSTSSPENLYILDPAKRAIWIEYQSQNYHEGSEYFGAIDSPTMQDAVDLATNGSELYMLHADGYLTKCVKESPTSNPQCTTPFEFSDPRPGHDSGPFIKGADFTSMFLKGSPGMAMYLLDPEDLAVYRFSTQLELQKQFRPQVGSIEGRAGAFAVTMSDRVFLAVGSQVYTAQLIP